MYVTTTDYCSPNAAKGFTESLKKTGFAILSNHPISPLLVESVYKDWEAFFKSEDKFKYLFDPNALGQTGYFPFQSENAKGNQSKDLKEFYDYRSSEGLPPETEQNTRQLRKDLTEMAAVLLGWVEDTLPEDIRDGLSCPLPLMIEKSDLSMLRILHYPPLKGTEEKGAIRAATHQDVNLLTLLPAATTPGLQVLDTQGNWHDVSCDPGTIVVNIGDMLQLATKGYYISTTHRVVNPEGETAKTSRYSLPLFLHARSDVQISENYTAGEFLAVRLREVGLSASSQET